LFFDACNPKPEMSCKCTLSPEVFFMGKALNCSNFNVHGPSKSGGSMIPASKSFHHSSKAAPPMVIKWHVPTILDKPLNSIWQMLLNTPQ
jgi:hypothetical protein